MAATERHLGYTKCTASNRWRSFDAHFQNGAVTMSYTVLPRKAAIKLVIDSSDQVTFTLPYLQDEKWLALCWRIFWSWGREPDTMILDVEGSQYLVYEWLQPSITQVTQDAQPKIVDAPLTLISRMVQWLCLVLFCQERLAVWWLWITATTSSYNYRAYKTKNTWRYVHAHFNVPCSRDLLPLIIAVIKIWTL